MRLMGGQTWRGICQTGAACFVSLVACYALIIVDHDKMSERRWDIAAQSRLFNDSVGDAGSMKQVLSVSVSSPCMLVLECEHENGTYTTVIDLSTSGTLVSSALSVHRRLDMRYKLGTSVLYQTSKITTGELREKSSARVWSAMRKRISRRREVTTTVLPYLEVIDVVKKPAPEPYRWTLQHEGSSQGGTECAWISFLLADYLASENPRRDNYFFLARDRWTSSLNPSICLPHCGKQLQLDILQRYILQGCAFPAMLLLYLQGSRSKLLTSRETHVLKLVYDTRKQCGRKFRACH
mmetsp:Transcript_10963/g.33632  ORF Transcript_10963/g.33632 Transcript_10963/m.33632 type:complete len:295 (+) Transcript_10963:1398-2282(+)